MELGVRFDGINGLNLGFTSHYEQRKVEQERSPRSFLAAGSLSYNSGVRPWLFVKVMGDTGSVAPECSTAENPV